jgi:hypothetical protein
VDQREDELNRFRSEVDRHAVLSLRWGITGATALSLGVLMALGRLPVSVYFASDLWILFSLVSALFAVYFGKRAKRLGTTEARKARVGRILGYAVLAVMVAFVLLVVVAIWIFAHSNFTF